MDDANGAAVSAEERLAVVDIESSVSADSDVSFRAVNVSGIGGTTPAVESEDPVEFELLADSRVFVSSAAVDKEAPAGLALF